MDLLLAEYAAGSLPAPLHALVGAHIELKPEAGLFVSSLEALKGAAVERDQPVVMATSRDAMLQAIFSRSDSGRETRQRVKGDLPAALDNYVGKSLSELPWRMVMPGVRQYLVEDRDGVEATLYWIKGGAKMPHHTHDGDEVTLVLKGGFTDVTGHYTRGDVAIADGDVDHRPVADDDGEDCYCFAVTTAPVRLTGPVGKYIQSIFRN